MASQTERDATAAFAQRLQALLQEHLAQGPIEAMEAGQVSQMWVAHGGHEFLVTVAHQRELPPAA